MLYIAYILASATFVGIIMFLLFLFPAMSSVTAIFLAAIFTFAQIIVFAIHILELKKHPDYYVKQIKFMDKLIQNIFFFNIVIIYATLIAVIRSIL